MKSLEVLVSFISAESGQDMIEYALCASVIGLGAVLSIRSVTTVIVNFFNTLSYMGSLF